MSFVGKHMELEMIILSKIGQTQKENYCMFSLHMQNIGRKEDDMKVSRETIRKGEGDKVEVSRRGVDTIKAF